MDEIGDGARRGSRSVLWRERRKCRNHLGASLGIKQIAKALDKLRGVGILEGQTDPGALSPARPRCLIVGFPAHGGEERGHPGREQLVKSVVPGGADGEINGPVVAGKREGVA